MKDCRTCKYCTLRSGLDCKVYVCNKSYYEQTFVNKPNMKCNEYIKDKNKIGDFYTDLFNQGEKL